MSDTSGDLPPLDFMLVAVSPAEPVFTLAAYKPKDADRIREQFSGREVRRLDQAVLSGHVQAEVRALLEIASRTQDGVTIGTTDGKGGWASWHLGFFAPKPGPVPELPNPTSSESSTRSADPPT